jgi:hypothetical protein
MHKPLEIGDRVVVTFTRHDWTCIGIIHKMPQASGDCWIIIRDYNNEPVHIQQYEAIQRWKDD